MAFLRAVPSDLICPRGRVAFVNAMKVREILRLLRDDGWQQVATRGSHMQFKHPTKAGRVTVAGHPNDDLAPGTVKSILVQASLKEP
jgi:predicted RNA binding protein YcfA (HicA-like mRNA interferase family)